MSNRYQVGFDEGTICVLADDNPDLVPVADTQSAFVCGTLVALAVDYSSAKRIVKALNIAESLEKDFFKI
jgi:hypothetical protein